MAALATSLSLPSVQAKPNEDWAKCLSIDKIPSAERISSCTAALASGTDSWASSRAYFLRGQAHFDEQNFEAAIADVSQFLHSYPSDVRGLQARAAAYFRQRNFDLAIADYTRVIEIEPKGPFAYAYRGEAYQAKGDLDRGIADYSKAIEINPTLAFAFSVRGHAYVAKGDTELAIANYNQAIQLDPENKSAYTGRADAHRLRGELDLAIADHDQVIRLDPQNPRAYFRRALVHWQSGALSQSLADFEEAGRLNPKSAYVVLWREIVAKRSDRPSRLAEATTQLDMTKWPAPIVNLFLGTLTPEQALSAADNSDANWRKAQVCEVNFYTAELALQRGSKEDARRLLELAATDCPKYFVESLAAAVELKALSENP